MKKVFVACLASLLASNFALCATDISGRWAGAPFYFIFKQDGTKLSGSGGPSEREQIVTFDNGVVDGDHITFKAGAIKSIYGSLAMRSGASSRTARRR